MLVALIRIGDAESALDVINLAEQTQRPDMTRWQAELNLARAEAYLLSGETEWACHQVTESYKIVKATGSEIQKKNVIILYNKISAQNPNQADVRQLGALLTTG